MSAPRKLYAEPQRQWGGFIPLYAAHSEKSWGAGNFSDWREICNWIGGTGAIYGASALVLSILFVALALPVAFRRAGEGDRMKPEKRLFGYSVLYLFALFTALVADRMILA